MTQPPGLHQVPAWREASITGYLCSVFLEAGKELLCFIFLVAGGLQNCSTLSLHDKGCVKDTKAWLVLGLLLGHCMSGVYAELPRTSGAPQHVTQLAWFRKHIVLAVGGILFDTRSTSANKSPLVLLVRSQSYWPQAWCDFPRLCALASWASSVSLAWVPVRLSV